MFNPCNRCKENPRHRGSYCKSCWAAIQRDWREKNLERVRLSNRLSKRRTRERDGPKETRRKWNEWYANNRDHRAEYQRNRNDKEKNRVYKLVTKAVWEGILIYPEQCSGCGDREKPLDAHHEDYSKPLEIDWLCRKCHSRLHNVKESI